MALLLGATAATGFAIGLSLTVFVWWALARPSDSRMAAAAMDVRARPAPVVRRSHSLPAERYIDGIMSRNLFDVGVIARWSPNDPDQGAAQPARLNVQLLGTVVARPARNSRAVVRHGDDPASKAYAVGDDLLGHEVVAIEQGSVTLVDAAGREKVLTISDGKSNEVASRSESQDPYDVQQGNVEQVAAGRYSIDPGIAERMTLNDLSRMGRIVPKLEPDGTFSGFTLTSIRDGKMAHALGLRNGDLLASVDGSPINSPEAAYKGFNAIDKSQGFCLGVVRQGSSVETELCYEVH